MSELLEVRAEITKLARLIAVEPNDLEFLERVGPAGLIELREQLVELFYGGEAGGLKRFVAPSKILPASVIAAITKEAVGPVLAARVAGLIEVDQAIAVVAKLPVKFVADISVELDPRRTGKVIGGLPAQTVAEISAELARRGEYVAMGRFVSYLSDEAIAGTFEHATDSALLQVAFVFEDKERLSPVVGLLSSERLSKIMRVAGKEGLWAEAFDLLIQLDDEQYERVIDLVSELDDKTLDSMVRTAAAEDLWPEAIGVTSDMRNPDGVIAAVNRGDGALIKSFVGAAAGNSYWDELSSIFEKLSEDRLNEFRKRAAQNRVLDALDPVKKLLV
jgi:hypothetical protein